ncbi:TRAP transporter small permease [Tropicibacter sp. Alg240-R139]|uniref:TRAP transporter small permease n=1 Tax=Tropicibacter sp. Alg240-R139 TaxID=2305991 RepID=UPI0013DF4EDA|nr:TRAP transporter small permease subunit [Tropicibacter sp. Alg240-R139]
MLEAVLNWLKRSESVVATIAYAVVAILLMVDVVGRELFSTSFLGMQQVAVYGAIVAGFLGLTLATSDNAHLRPEFLDFIAGPFDRHAVRLGDLLSAAFFFAATHVAVTFVQISYEAGDKAPVLYFALWPLQLVIPYAFFSAGLKHLIFALKPSLKHFTSEARG